jgi:hypothetical protein
LQSIGDASPAWSPPPEASRGPESALLLKLKLRLGRTSAIELCWFAAIRAFRKPPRGQNEHENHAGEKAKHGARTGRPAAHRETCLRVGSPIALHAPSARFARLRHYHFFVGLRWCASTLSPQGGPWLTGSARAY